MHHKIYLIGNAHLDPVWMWRWQEGTAEVRHTFRSALDRMKEFPDFKFTCAAAVTYKWIEEMCPEMLEEIKERVREGRWIVAGGWWVQPDCNQPSGESFARHGLYSQRFFKEKLGVTAKTGYNVDSFGHNRNIPQLLVKCGMTDYVMMRPGEHEKHLESNMFIWRAPDGSSVRVFRIPYAYCCDFGKKEELLQRIRDLCSVSDPNADATMLFYGVGNHGGGPTKKNIAFLYELRDELKAEGVELIFGSPDDFFAQLRADETPLWTHDDDLQHHASGCYAAVSAVKAANRACENRLLAAEKYSALASKYTGMPYPADKIKTAWENTLFNQFHDSLGGCSIKPVYSDAAEFAGEALSIAAKTENAALQRIAGQINTDGEGTPIAVFNPLTWDVEHNIRLNGQFSAIRGADGELLPSQLIRSETQSCYGRMDTLVRVKAPALGWTVIRAVDGESTSENTLSVSDDGKILENDKIKVAFNPHTGYIESITDKQNGSSILNGAGAVPIVIDEYLHDTWSHGRNFFDNEIARFSDAKLTVTERGPVRATVKVVSRYNGSTLTQYFSLTAGSPLLEVSAVVDWHEKHKLLKLSYDAEVRNPRAFYEIPYADIERPCDGEEECGLRWTAVRGDDGGLALLNDRIYSHSIKAHSIALTVVRSPIYGDHGNTRSDESPFTDQGEHEFSYTVMPLAPEAKVSSIIRAAAELNSPCTAIIDNIHDGSLPVRTANAYTDAENVIIEVVKRSEDGEGIVIRAYETDGEAARAVLSLPITGVTVETDFTPHEIKTLYIGKNGCREIPITEIED